MLKEKDHRDLLLIEIGLMMRMREIRDLYGPDALLAGMHLAGKALSNRTSLDQLASELRNTGIESNNTLGSLLTAFQLKAAYELWGDQFEISQKSVISQGV